MLPTDPIPTAKRTRFKPAAGIAARNVQAAIEELAVDVAALAPAPVDFKDSVRVATTTNIALSGLQTIDSVLLSHGNRVLVKNQFTASQNGIYTASSGAWARATDADGNPEVTAGMIVVSTEGVNNGDLAWELTTNDPIVLGTTNLTFRQFTREVISVFGRTGVVAKAFGDYAGADIEETLTVTNYTPTSPTVEGYLDGLDNALGSLPPSYTDDDVIGVLSEVLEDGIGIQWNVYEDSLGTHFQPDRLQTLHDDEYAAEITLDFRWHIGERHNVPIDGDAAITFAEYKTGEKMVVHLVPSVDDAVITFTDDITWLRNFEPPRRVLSGRTLTYEFLCTDDAAGTFDGFEVSSDQPRGVVLVSPNTANQIAYWKLDEASGTRVDARGSFDLTDNNTVTQGNGQFGHAAEFTAANSEKLSHAHDVGLMPSPAVNNGDFSIVCWFRPATTQTAGLIHKQIVSSGDMNYELSLVSGNLRFKVGTVTGIREVAWVGNPSLQNWHLAVAVMDSAGDRVRLSLDGGTFVNTAMGGWPFPTGTGGSELNLGARINANYFNGRMDETAFYRRAIGQSEVATLWNGGWGLAVGEATVDWSLCDAAHHRITTSGTHQIDHDHIIPDKILRLSVENDGGSGSMAWSANVDWGDDGPPSLPVDGTLDLYEFTAISATKLIGKVLQTGVTP